MKSNPQWRIPAKDKHVLGAGLYLISTPIGNARDITLRALDTLCDVDILLAEDTRRARQLLQLYGIQLNNRPLLACHDHNEAELAKRCAEWASEGKTVGFVSDAGMPLISDPGFRLVEEMRKQNLPFTVLPGASSVPTALALSGLPSDRFSFHGFLPSKQKARIDVLKRVETAKDTVIFFETAKRIEKTIADMRTVFEDDKHISIARELTKRFEEVMTGTLAEIAQRVHEHETLKGEIVLLLAPSQTPVATENEIDSELAHALQTMKTKEAARVIATKFNMSRQDAYQRALKINSDKN